MRIHGIAQQARALVTRRLTLLEAIALCALTGAAVWYAAAAHWAPLATYFSALSGSAHQESQLLREVYGPDRHSESFEEWIIRDHFQDRRGGVFLDVGANHYRDGSNTYFLETSLGWSGIAVDALAEFGPDYERYRPRTRFVAMFASDSPNSTVEFFVGEGNHLVSSSSRAFVEAAGVSGKARTIPTTTLDALLAQAKIERIDFLTMDIELSEPGALAGFDIDRFRPGLVCIEGHLEVRQQILDYFARHRYVLVGKYMRADAYNLYFKPLVDGLP